MSDPTTGAIGTGEPRRPVGSAASRAALDTSGAARRAEAPPKPKIGDTRPAPPVRGATPGSNGAGPPKPRRRRRGGRGRGGRPHAAKPEAELEAVPAASRPVRASGRPAARPARAEPIGREPDDAGEAGRTATGRRRGRERKGRPVGRYLMCVHVAQDATQIAVLEGRSLIEHYVARALDDANQIDGNIYRGRVQNVLPGMEAAFVDIGTPKNAVLYWGDVQTDRDEGIERDPRHDPDRAPAAARPDDHLPGHEEPDRRQGRPSHPGGLASGPLRRPRPGVERQRHLEAARRRRAQAPAQDARRDPARRSRDHRPHGRRGRERRGAAPGRRAAREDLGRDRRQGEAPPRSGAFVLGAAHRRAGDPGGVHRGVPRGHHRRPGASTSRSATTSPRSTRSSPTVSSTTTRKARTCRSSSATTSTSSCTRRSTARSGSPPAGRSSSSAPRR